MHLNRLTNLKPLKICKPYRVSGQSNFADATNSAGWSHRASWTALSTSTSLSTVTLVTLWARINEIKINFIYNNMCVWMKCCVWMKSESTNFRLVRVAYRINFKLLLRESVYTQICMYKYIYMCVTRRRYTQ